jgi:DNA-binding response OmpR family regulator
VPKRILIIDDDPDAVELVSYSLQLKGYEISTAHNGVDGLAFAREKAPDLVILDVMLPGTDGIEICQTLRSDPSTTRLPILMLSARARQKDVELGQRAGADLYITKPIALERLAAWVETFVSRDGDGILP